MADNTTRFATASGDVIRADELIDESTGLASSKVQALKLLAGADGVDGGFDSLFVGANGDKWNEIQCKLGLVAERFERRADLNKKPRGGPMFNAFYNAAAVAGPYNPATDALTGWWKPHYAGTPWVGSASVGTSGSNNLTGAPPPNVGAGVGGWTPADFDGATTFLSGAALSTFLGAGATAWRMAVLVNARTVVADPGAGSRFNAPCIASDTAAFFVIAVTNSGVSMEMADGVGAASTLTVAMSTASFHVVTAGYDGVNLWLRIDAGTPQTQAYAVIGGTAANLQIGANWNHAAIIDGIMGEIHVQNSAPTLAWSNAVGAYLQSKFSQSLGF